MTQNIIVLSKYCCNYCGKRLWQDYDCYQDDDVYYCSWECIQRVYKTEHDWLRHCYENQFLHAPNGKNVLMTAEILKAMPDKLLDVFHKNNVIDFCNTRCCAVAE